jgi:hypothetical protein
LYQSLDILTAFLEKEVFMAQLEGFAVSRTQIMPLN